MVDPNPQIQTGVTKIAVYRYTVLRKTAPAVSTHSAHDNKCDQIKGCWLGSGSGLGLRLGLV